MRDEGILTFYNLQNVASPGMKPVEKLVNLGVTAFYENKQIGVQRLNLAKGGDFSLDKLVRCYNTILPEKCKYVILEDGEQYRIGAANAVVDEDGWELSLERLGNYYEVADESSGTTTSSVPSP